MDWARLVATKPQGPTVIEGVCVENSNTELRSAQRDRQTAARSENAQLTPETQPNSGEWDPETAKLIRWFMGTEPPSDHFELQQAVFIARPGLYWAYLRQNIADGPNCARGRTGALQDDLRRLHQLFGGE